MVKSLQDWNVTELGRELRKRQQKIKWKSHEIILSWTIDNGHEVDDYAFEEPLHPQLRAAFDKGNESNADSSRNKEIKH